MTYENVPSRDVAKDFTFLRSCKVIAESIESLDQQVKDAYILWMQDELRRLKAIERGAYPPLIQSLTATAERTRQAHADKVAYRDERRANGADYLREQALK